MLSIAYEDVSSAVAPPTSLPDLLESATALYRKAFAASGSAATAGAAAAASATPEPTVGVAAPGRVNLIGEHTDYNDGFVMPMCLRNSTVAVAGFNGLGLCRIVSVQGGASDIPYEFTASGDPKVLGPSKDKATSWTNYVTGVFAQYAREHPELVDGKLNGLDVAFASDVPLGGGLSSSASLEVATATVIEAMAVPADSTMAAVRRWTDAGRLAKSEGSQGDDGAEAAAEKERPKVSFKGATTAIVFSKYLSASAAMRKALLSVEAEHEFPGVPCGIMDQAWVFAECWWRAFHSSPFRACAGGRSICRSLSLSVPPPPDSFAFPTPADIPSHSISALGREGHALLLDCRSKTTTYVDLNDPDLAVVVCNSNHAHELNGGEYAERVAQCKEALARVKALLEKSEDEAERAAAAKMTHLRDVSVAQLAAAGRVRSESTAASGDAGGEEEEPIWLKRARHGVTEDDRTLAALEAASARDWKNFGQLMYGSHESLSKDYEVSTPQLDALVEIARSVPGVYGSRMTGGGFGGCTVSLSGAIRVAFFLPHSSSPTCPPPPPPPPHTHTPTHTSHKPLTHRSLLSRRKPRTRWSRRSSQSTPRERERRRRSSRRPRGLGRGCSSTGAWREQRGAWRRRRRRRRRRHHIE